MPDQPYPDSAHQKRWNIPSVIAIFLMLVFLLPAFRRLDYDTLCWVNWCTYTQEHGLSNAYGSGSDYFPLYHYVLWIFGRLCQHGETMIGARIHYLRIFTLAFDFLGLYIVYRWTDRKVPLPALLLLAFGTLSIAYNTIVWGQVDGIWTTLAFAGYYFAWKGRLTWASVFMALALCMKLQAIILLPLWSLLMIDAIMRIGRRSALVSSIKCIATFLITILIIVLPFAFGEGGLSAIWRVVTGSLGMFPVVSLSADNIWFWILAEPARTPDTTVAIASLNYKTIGIIMFFSASLLTLWPLMRHILRKMIADERATAMPDRNAIWLMSALICMYFFYFTTEMHERYVHPAGIFLLAYAFYTNRWGPCILFSIAYFLNLEVISQWLALSMYDTLLFHPRMISTLFAGSIIWCVLLLWKRHSVATSDPITTPSRPV